MFQQQASTPVSPLRRRMLDDMAMRGLHEDTQRNYIMSVRNFAAFLGRSPETATPEDVRRFQIHQADSGVQPRQVHDRGGAGPSRGGGRARPRARRVPVRRPGVDRGRPQTCKEGLKRDLYSGRSVALRPLWPSPASL